MKYRDLVTRIEDDGWILARTNGSHRIYHHPSKRGIVILAWHARSDDVPPGTYNAILKQAGLSK